jgi:alkylation response protein AidB-like acyl-CoA dehydrogenase
MDFEFTERQLAVKEIAHEFALRELQSVAAELDRNDRHPDELLEKMGELGLLGISVPKAHGGAGHDYVSYALALEEISWGSASTGAIMCAHNSLACVPVQTFGTEEQKKTHLTSLASGKALGCFALTEPEAGSDIENQKTTALRDGKTWVITGRKIFITGANVARLCILCAKSQPASGGGGISTFIVDLETPGVSLGTVEEKLGMRSSGTAELIFEECRIPEENLLGEEGSGLHHIGAARRAARIGAAAQAVGIARAALEAALEFSKKRIQFGKTLSHFQEVQHRLADMGTEIDAARLMVLKAAYLTDAGRSFERESAMAKLFACDVAQRAAAWAVEVCGGYGYTARGPLERYFRDAKITEIHEGTPHMQRATVAGSILGTHEALFQER